MQVIVLASEEQKKELLAPGTKEGVSLVWISHPEEFANHCGADAWIDLLYSPEHTRMEFLEKLAGKPMIVHSVKDTLNDLPSNFIRINGWPGFLNRPVAEAAGSDEKMMRNAEAIFAGLNRKTEWTQDIPGFITARIVAMIINEACFALSEKISSKEEIDLAMKLGTNYPFGPFEWGERIGWKNIFQLLEILSASNSRYQPAPLLIQEADR